MDCKILLRGISPEITEDRLRDHFARYGHVVQAVISRDKLTHRPRGTGFIVFAGPAALNRLLADKHRIDATTELRVSRDSTITKPQPFSFETKNRATVRATKVIQEKDVLVRKAPKKTAPKPFSLVTKRRVVDRARKTENKEGPAECRGRSNVLGQGGKSGQGGRSAQGGGRKDDTAGNKTKVNHGKEKGNASSLLPTTCNMFSTSISSSMDGVAHDDTVEDQPTSLQQCPNHIYDVVDVASSEKTFVADIEGLDCSSHTTPIADEVDSYLDGIANGPLIAHQPILIQHCANQSFGDIDGTSSNKSSTDEIGAGSSSDITSLAEETIHSSPPLLLESKGLFFGSSGASFYRGSDPANGPATEDSSKLPGISARNPKLTSLNAFERSGIHGDIGQSKNLEILQFLESDNVILPLDLQVPEFGCDGLSFGSLTTSFKRGPYLSNNPVTKDWCTPTSGLYHKAEEDLSKSTPSSGIHGDIGQSENLEVLQFLESDNVTLPLDLQVPEFGSDELSFGSFKRGPYLVNKPVTEDWCTPASGLYHKAEEDLSKSTQSSGIHGDIRQSKNLEILQFQESDNVILPLDLEVPEFGSDGLSFGSLTTSFKRGTYVANNPITEDWCTPASGLYHKGEEDLSKSRQLSGIHGDIRQSKNLQILQYLESGNVILPLDLQVPVFGSDGLSFGSLITSFKRGSYIANNSVTEEWCTPSYGLYHKGEEDLSKSTPSYGIHGDIEQSRNLEILQLLESDNVILPHDLQIPEFKSYGLNFGNCIASSKGGTYLANSPTTEDRSTPSSGLSPEAGESISRSIPSSGIHGEIRQSENLEILEFSKSDNVIIPLDLQVPEFESHGVSFGDFIASFKRGPYHAEEDLSKSTPSSGLYHEAGEGLSRSSRVAVANGSGKEDQVVSTSRVYALATDLAMVPYVDRQARKPSDKLYGSNGYIWAPVRTSNKNDSSDDGHQSSTFRASQLSYGKEHDVQKDKGIMWPEMHRPKGPRGGRFEGSTLGNPEFTAVTINGARNLSKRGNVHAVWRLREVTEPSSLKSSAEGVNSGPTESVRGASLQHNSMITEKAQEEVPQQAIRSLIEKIKGLNAKAQTIKCRTVEGRSGIAEKADMHATMKEVALCRAKQLQHEEEERRRQQKARARAKLEELDRRILAEVRQGRQWD